MSSFRYHRLPVLTSIGFALFASLVGAPVQARTPYDGLWSVSLKVGQGSCSEREIEVFIRNGEISHAGDRGFFTAEGRVGERGRIEVSIGAFGMWASADGQLSDRQGSGVLGVCRAGVLRAVGGAPQLLTTCQRPTRQSAAHSWGS